MLIVNILFFILYLRSILDDPHCHPLSRLGWLVAVQYVLRIAKGGLFWSGLPCSMHIWMSTGTSKKTRANPQGSSVYQCVADANKMAARFGLLVLLAMVRGVYWCTEQPSSSFALFLPYLEAALNPNLYMLGFPAGLIQKLPLA